MKWYLIMGRRYPGDDNLFFGTYSLGSQKKAETAWFDKVRQELGLTRTEFKHAKAGGEGPSIEYVYVSDTEMKPVP